MNIPPYLSRRLYDTLMTSGFFESDSHLRALFVDVRLVNWRYRIPEAQTPDMRVRKLIESLFDQYDAAHQNVLVLLLHVIQAQFTPTNVLYQELTDLIQRLAQSTAPLHPDTPAWDQALGRYRELLYQKYGRMQIFGQPRPVKLDDIFTTVYMLDQPRAFQRFDIRQVRHTPNGAEYAQRLNGLDLLTGPQGQRLFVLGKPGSGKTTFLKYVTLHAANQQIPKTPIFIELKKWAGSDLTLPEFIELQFEPCAIPDVKYFVENLLQTGRALLLCDSLDEVSSLRGLRSQATVDLKTFAQHYAKTQIVLTCRNAATDYTFEGFTYVEIADFDATQIATFVERWFDNNTVKRDAFLAELAIPAHRGLRELSRVPLLLTMLCLAFEINMTFPQRRAELYADALDALLRKWDSSRNIKRDSIYQGLSVGRKHQLFARLAAHMFEREEYCVPQKHIETQIAHYLDNLPYADKGDTLYESEAILKAIEAQHGILVEQSRQIYAFAHLTFQEYYTARYIIDNARRRSLPRLLTHSVDIRWREVILITASLLDEADDFFVLFRHILKHQIQAEPELQRLLAWATSKTTATPADVAAIHRSTYCLLAANELREWPKVRVQALNLVLTLDREKRFVQPATRLPLRSRRTNILMGQRPSHLILDRMLMQFLHRAETLTLVRDYDLADTATHDLQPMLREILIYCQKADAQNLYQSLQALQLPSPESPKSAFQTFVAHLRTLLHTQRDLVYDWQLTSAQAQNLANYFYSVLLFVECLDLAYVTNRTRLAHDLLTPLQTVPEQGCK